MKGFFEHQYLSFKKNHLSNLIALARVDDNFADAEIDFIYKLGKKYGLKERHITALLNNQDEIKLVIPEAHETKINQLFDLVGMMLADGVAEPVELEFCEGVANRFGLSKEVISALTTYYRKYAYPQEDWRDFVEETKKFRF